jgi:hypothetical protein
MAPPVPEEDHDQFLAAAGLDRRWGYACQDASHSLQGFYQKEGLEAARLDPTCDGYSFWTIVDVIVRQGNTYSAQGFLNAFWEPKPNGNTPEDLLTVNAATVLMLKTNLSPRIAVSGDRVRADFWISHYGEQRLIQTQLAWTLRTGRTVLSKGVCAGGDVELGSVQSLAQVDLLVPDLKKPVHAILEVTVVDSAIRNQWDFWLFPKRTVPRVTGIAVAPALLPKLTSLLEGLVTSGDPGYEQASLLISSIGAADVEPALAAGKRVLLINSANGKPNVSLGWWWMGNQVGTAFASHPALGEFPPQWVPVTTRIPHPENRPNVTRSNWFSFGRDVCGRRRAKQLFPLRG